MFEGHIPILKPSQISHYKGLVHGLLTNLISAICLANCLTTSECECDCSMKLPTHNIGLIAILVLSVNVGT